MVLNIELRQDEAQVVANQAKLRGVSVEQFAREAVLAYSNRVSDEEFRKHLEASAIKNRELLRRLA